MRVVVAEDVMLTREGITRVLRDAGIDVVGEASDAASLLRAVRLTQPDAAIVDIRMPPTHTDEGLVAARQIRAEHPNVGVLILSQYIEPHYALQLLEDHPERAGYLLKERVFDVVILIDALRRLADGETIIDPTIVSRLVSRQRRTDPLAELTVREREVLELVAEGLLKRSNRNATLRHRAHSRSACQADLHKTRSTSRRRRKPSRAGRARIPPLRELSTGLVQENRAPPENS